MLRVFCIVIFAMGCALDDGDNDPGPRPEPCYYAVEDPEGTLDPDCARRCNAECSEWCFSANELYGGVCNDGDDLDGEARCRCTYGTDWVD